MSRHETKLGKFFDFAFALAELSCCKRASAGCVIAPPDFSAVYSIGYNGPPAGIANDSCTEEPKQCGCVHAEANALIKLGNVCGAVILITRAPCVHCAGLLINSGKIDMVYYVEDYTDNRGLETLRNANIQIRRIVC